MLDGSELKIPKNKDKFELNSLQILTIGFAVVILVGALLLMLPISSKEGTVPFINALFTSTSATCVTGLVVYDTYSQFTVFGQIVILMLIQIGGLGFMTIAILFSMMLGRRIGLRERSILMDSISSLKIGGIVKMTKYVIIGTATIEMGGALILATRFCPKFGLAKGLWYGVFHAVSAFCNAGFDLMGTIEPGSSLIHFSGDAVVNLTIMSLIIVGGIGFVVWMDIIQKKHHVRKYNLHTKLMISATILLIAIPALIFFYCEKNHSFAGMHTNERILASLFATVTPRTAGFNTVSVASMSDGGTLLSIILMFIGAGPGSTGGGIKVTTFVVFALSVLSYARKQKDLNVYRRRLEDSIVKRACGNTGFYLFVCVLGIFVLTFQNIDFKDAIFEAFSAVGTVGLTRGVTPTLPSLSKIAIIILMYSGRVGTLSVAMAVSIEHRDKSIIKNPVEKIIIG